MIDGVANVLQDAKAKEDFGHYWAPSGGRGFELDSIIRFPLQLLI